MAATTRNAQPARNSTPPIGVMAPNLRRSVNASAYRLPLNTTTPATKHQPAAAADPLAHRTAIRAEAIVASACHSW